MPMKVAFLTGSTHRSPRLGGEARIFHLSKFLASSGITVGLFGSRFEEDLIGSRMSQFRSFRNWSGGDWYPYHMKSAPTLLRNIPPLIRLSQVWKSYDVIISELG